MNIELVMQLQRNESRPRAFVILNGIDNNTIELNDTIWRDQPTLTFGLECRILREDSRLTCVPDP